MGAVVVIAFASVLLNLSLNYIEGWQLVAACPGTDSFCNGTLWTTVVGYAPSWMFIAQILIVLSMGSPVAVLRIRR